jgi:hypothetical protein
MLSDLKDIETRLKDNETGVSNIVRLAFMVFVIWKLIMKAVFLD